MVGPWVSNSNSKLLKLALQLTLSIAIGSNAMPIFKQRTKKNCWHFKYCRKGIAVENSKMNS
jgi:hypothetical protein